MSSSPDILTEDTASKDTRKRVVVKAGTALITRGGSLDIQTMASLVDQIAHLQTIGYEMILVSSGAVAAGRHVLDVSGARRNLPMRQVFSAVGQGRLMNVYAQLFDWHSVSIAQALITGRDLRDREGYLNIRNTLLRLMQYDVVPIVNENDVVAVEELKGEISIGDNDMLSAMVANIVDADLLLLLGRVGGLFTADPNLDPNAELIAEVTSFTSEIEALAGPPADRSGRGGMATKLEAAKLATASGVDTIAASGRTPDIILRLISGEQIGTHFPTEVTRMESRKRYLLSQMQETDAIVIDSGAVCALVDRNSSLLSAGIIDSVGGFERGSIVTVLDTERRQIACGISNYSASDIRQIRRLRSDRIELTLGHYFGDEVIHKDNLVIINE